MDIENCEPEIIEMESKYHSSDYNCNCCNQTDCCYWIYYNKQNEENEEN